MVEMWSCWRKGMWSKRTRRTRRRGEEEEEEEEGRMGKEGEGEEEEGGEVQWGDGPRGTGMDHGGATRRWTCMWSRRRWSSPVADVEKPQKTLDVDYGHADTDMDMRTWTCRWMLSVEEETRSGLVRGDTQGNGSTALGRCMNDLMHTGLDFGLVGLHHGTSEGDLSSGPRSVCLLSACPSRPCSISFRFQVKLVLYKENMMHGLDSVRADVASDGRPPLRRRCQGHDWRRARPARRRWCNAPRPWRSDRPGRSGCRACATW